MNSILKKIVTHKKKEVERLKQTVPIDLLKQRPYFNRQIISAKEALVSENSSRIIAEFKRRSPSKGSIKKNANVDQIIASYEKAGAAICSVLTDRQFFGAKKKDFEKARKISTLPLLRKEFIVDAYQIYETKALGADLMLLIASILSPDDYKKYTRIAKQIGLEVLLEIHNEKELNCLSDDVDLVGVNNRDLNTFKVDLNQSINLAEKIPQNFTKVSESGISNPEAINLLKQYGYQGFLIGEHFMTKDKPGLACEKLVSSIK